MTEFRVRAATEADVTELVDLTALQRHRPLLGLRALGQPLKSFRDRRVDFTVYDRSRFSPRYLESLGPLVKPQLRSGGLSADNLEEAHVVRGDAGGQAQKEEN